MAKNENQFVNEIADFNTAFPEWYTDVVIKTQLCDYGPVKGTMVFRPYGYAIWEHLQRQLDERIKKEGHQNAYFPILIPESFLNKEKEHVEGFAPEVALVTHIGNEELSEKLILRPTSETIMGHMFSKWIQSYRDLPLLINQWANVIRMEKTTRPFLRTSEFLWQEGHTLHETEKEAREHALKMLNVYVDFLREVLALPCIAGKKSEREKFAGAVETYGIECMMHDGKSLQSGTSHYLGQNFSKAFDIQFLNRDNKLEYCYYTSWGVTTRLIGALIMVHGDQRGLSLPPKVAPVQVVIVPIQQQKDGVLDVANKIKKQLENINVRVFLDDRDASPGWKFNESEMKGMPIRLEVGPRDIENNQCILVRRDSGEKIQTSIDEIETKIPELLDNIQKEMYSKAKKYMEERIVVCKSLEEIGKALDEKKFAKVMWCGEENCEQIIKDKFQATSRVMPFGEEPFDDVCPICGKKAKHVMIFARAY